MTSCARLAAQGAGRSLTVINGMSVAKLSGADKLATSIDLSSGQLRRGLDHLDVAIIGSLVSHNHTLTSLDLSGNKAVGDRAGEAIGAALLEGAAHLATVNLARTGLGDVGGEALFQAIRSSTTLTKIDASGNALGGRSVAALATALEANGVLRHVDISEIASRRAHLDSKGSTKAPATSTSLDGKFSKAVSMLADALLANRTLQHLHAFRSARYWDALRGDGAVVPRDALLLRGDAAEGAAAADGRTDGRSAAGPDSTSSVRPSAPSASSLSIDDGLLLAALVGTSAHLTR